MFCSTALKDAIFAQRLKLPTSQGKAAAQLGTELGAANTLQQKAQTDAVLADPLFLQLDG
jgi:hypothetical protein